MHSIPEDARVARHTAQAGSHSCHDDRLWVSAHPGGTVLMKVIVIAPLSAAQVAELQAIDARLVVEQVWELFGP